MRILIFLFFLVNINSYSQTFAFEKERHLFNVSLISKNALNKVSKKRFEKEYEYEAKYLGKFKIKNREFYIINSSYVNLKSLHNDNQIFIYNSKRYFVGYYNLATNYQLPIKLVDNILFFKTEKCEEKVILKNEIPKTICIGCENKKDCVEFQKP